MCGEIPLHQALIIPEGCHLNVESKLTCSGETSATEQIPRRFIFVYGLHPQQEPFHLIHYLCLRSCLEVNQPEQICLYSPKEPYGHYWDLIKADIKHEVIEPVEKVANFHYNNRSIDAFRYAHHSDFIRLEKLLEQGGVYADLDTLFVKPLPDELFQNQFVLGREHDILDPHTDQSARSLCNAVIMSAPGAEFCHRWLAAMDEAFDGTWSNHSTLLPQRLADSHPQDIHIEPESAFFHFTSTDEGLSLLFDTTADIPDHAYSMHLWAHLWWSVERQDFSAFDAGRITEEYVREGKTTYSKAAQAFLPETRSPFNFGIIRRKAAGISTLVRRSLSNWRNVKRAALRPDKVQLMDGAGDARYRELQSLTFHRAIRKLQIDDVFERSIFDRVILQDHYNLELEEFAPSDVIIDIGAHLGAFILLCHALGSRNVHGYEPEPGNYARLERHLKAVKGVYLDPAAVFRSDHGYSGARLTHSGPLGVNTGGGNVIMDGLQLAHMSQRVWLLPEHISIVDTIALDDLLRLFDRVALLKVSCVGSEFPILLTSQELKRVDKIVGEYGEISPELMTRLDQSAKVGNLRSFSAGLLGA